MRPALLVLAGAAWLGRRCHGLEAAAEEGACTAAEGPGCKGAAAAPPAKKAPRRHFWPTKGGNLNGSGFAEVAVALPLEKISWTYRPSAIVHTSPVIDDEHNVYVSDTGGRIISLTKDGQVRWSYQASGKNAGVPALHGDALYCFTDDGAVVSLALDSGKVLWWKKAAISGPSDSATVVVYRDMVLVPLTLDFYLTSGACDILAFDLEDGTMRWRYGICNRSKKPTFNGLPSVVDGMVIVHDMTGGMHAFSVEDGTPRWYYPGPSNDTMSTGASATGPDNLAYYGFVREGNCDKGLGMVRAHDIYTGQVAWTRNFDRGINAGVAVGRLKPDGPTAVVALVSDNFMPQMASWQSAVLASQLVPAFAKLWVLQMHTFVGTVVAMDARTGATIWTFNVDLKDRWGYPGLERGCLPDCFGTPSIGADGTIYVNWSGGMSYAIRDANGDSFINGTDPREVSKLNHGFGTNGQTAIAPGLLVAPTCEAIIGWAS